MNFHFRVRQNAAQISGVLMFKCSERGRIPVSQQCGINLFLFTCSTYYSHILGKTDSDTLCHLKSVSSKWRAGFLPLGLETQAFQNSTNKISGKIGYMDAKTTAATA